MLGYIYNNYPQVRVDGRPWLEVPLVLGIVVFCLLLAMVLSGASGATVSSVMTTTLLLGAWTALSTWRYAQRRDRLYRLSLVYGVRFVAAALAVPLLQGAFWPMTYAASLLSDAADTITLPVAVPVTAALFIGTGTIFAVIGGWLLTLRYWPGFAVTFCCLALLAGERVFTADLLHPWLPTHIPPLEARDALRDLGFLYIQEVEPWERGLPPARIAPRPQNDLNLRP